MPKVLNRRHTRDDDAVYIGRRTKWGNRFIIGKDGDREAVIKKYGEWIKNKIAEDPDLLEEIRYELGGKNLSCWCAPLPCHGDILIMLANPEEK